MGTTGGGSTPVAVAVGRGRLVPTAEGMGDPGFHILLTSMLTDFVSLCTKIEN